MKKIALLICFLMLMSLQANASESMRHCMLLPITDGVDNKVGFQIFEEIENYIKDGSWCTYKSNSELINILSQYSKNLESHLANKDVLKVISDKTKAGTLIKISLILAANTAEVKLEVIGENGEDRYFKEQTQLRSNDVGIISRTVKNWLDVYEKTIPYSGKIKGVLGDQFTIDIGRKSQIFNGSEIIIERPIGKRKHPLLKEVVEFETEKVGEAKIIDVNEYQAQARATSYEGSRRLKIDDWVKVRSLETRKTLEQIPFADKEDNEFGKLGSVGLFINLGSGSLNLTGNSASSMKGIIIGGDLEAELWATRNWWTGLDYGKKFIDYKPNKGSFENGSNSADNSSMRFKIGYKYLPLGFFYGPQIDGYFGYGSYTYGLNTSISDKITEVTFSGVLLGAKGSIPLFQGVRATLLIDFLLTSAFKEKVSILGTDESSSNYRLELGAQYTYETNITLSTGLQILSNKASFNGVIKEEQFKDTSAKVGAVFTF